MPQPLYLQIADELEEQIRSGDLSPGSQLPTEDDLRDKYRASRNTIRDAIKRLVGQGLVETRPGQGTFVTTKVDPFVTVLTGNRAGRWRGRNLLPVRRERLPPEAGHRRS